MKQGQNVEMPGIRMAEPGNQYRYRPLALKKPWLGSRN
jgi:hypothetical protein